MRLGISNVNFIRVELRECEFNEGWALWMWILWELGTVNVHVMSTMICRWYVYKNWAELCECEIYESWAFTYEFYESWVLWMCRVWVQSFANVNFIRAELGFALVDFYESWALWMWILWELGIANVNFMRAEYCKCEFYGSWALQKRISYKLNFAEMSLLRAAHCECEFYESWS